MNDREQLVREANELIVWLTGVSGWHNEKADLIRRLLSLLPKEGEVVVPVEPTDEMLLACDYCHTGFAKQLYVDLIESRPK